MIIKALIKYMVDNVSIYKEIKNRSTTLYQGNVDGISECF